MSHTQSRIHRMFEHVEAIGTVTFSAGVTEGFLELGMRNYWDGYFAGRAAPLGLAPAEVVDAVFYNFAPGEVARHIPWVWGRTTPQEAIAVRQRGSAAELRRLIGDLADSAGLGRLVELATRAAYSAPTDGRPLYAGLRALQAPSDPVAGLWHAATMLREHRGDGHNAVLLAHGIGGTEAHVLFALGYGIRPQQFGRIHHLPENRLRAVIDGLQARGLVDATDGFTEAGRDLKQRIEDLTDQAAGPAYEVLNADELDELTSGLDPITQRIQEARGQQAP